MDHHTHTKNLAGLLGVLVLVVLLWAIWLLSMSSDPFRTVPESSSQAAPAQSW